MAERKKTSPTQTEQERLEFAETLRRAAELLEKASAQQAEEAPAKKAPAKKPAAKKSTTKSASASKSSAKKTTTKKPATKTAPKKAEAPAAEAAEQPVAEEPVVQPEQEQLAPVAEEPVPTVVEEAQKAEQSASEPVVEQKAEQPAPEPVVEQKVEQPAATQDGKKTGSFKSKSKAFIDNKGKFPLFIVANSLLFLSFIFLLIGAFSISTVYGKSIYGNMFTYYDNGTAIKAHWYATAGAWANGGYVMIGILMTLACLVPLALVIKNVICLIIKNDKNVHMFDAVVTFAFLIAYLGVVNMYGANMTWAHILVLVMSIILLAYTIFVILIENSEGAFPFFSIANLVMVTLCMFLLTSNKIYASAGWYAAHAAAYSGSGGFAFVMLLVGLAALVLIAIMQVKKLPGKIAWLFEFLVPAVAGVCALIALILFASGKPTGLSLGGGFIFGAVLTMLFAVADIVFALVPQLHKYNVKVTDRMSVAQPAPAAAQSGATDNTAPVENAQNEKTSAESVPVENKPTEAPAENGEKIYCPGCGAENVSDAMYCMKCGRKLK